MADFVFRAALGRSVSLVDDTDQVGILILASGGENDDAMFERETVADLLAGSSEVTNANYARKTSPATIADNGDGVLIDAANVTWVNVGVGDTWAKLVIFADGGSDDLSIPLSAHDFAVTPNTGNITAQFGGLIEVN